MTKKPIKLRIILESPPANVQYGIQQGMVDTIQVSRSDGRDLIWDIEVFVADQQADGKPRFVGNLVHGPTGAKFIYIRIGKSAGDPSSCWSRRAKIPLLGIGWEMVTDAINANGLSIEARFPGKAKDGTPSCASLKPLDQGWQLLKTSIP